MHGDGTVAPIVDSRTDFISMTTCVSEAIIKNQVYDPLGKFFCPQGNVVVSNVNACCCLIKTYFYDIFYTRALPLSRGFSQWGLVTVNKVG